MTEQTRIPVPGERSLFERAEDAIGGEFQGAPVPADLAEARTLRKTVRKAMLVEEMVEHVPEHAPAEPLPADRHVAESAPSKTAEALRTAGSAIPATRVEFAGPRVAIDRALLRERGLIEPGGPATALLEEFRLVKRQLLLAVRDGRGQETAQRVLVCSPLPGEGKTFCAVNLALAIAAERDSEVVLVDADFAKPSIPHMLGFPAEGGLMDALSHPEQSVEDFVITTDVPGLFVLPAGRGTAHDSEYLASAHTRGVLGRLTQGAPDRIVIFDSPPALAASPASELADHVGQALLVCRADQTGLSALEDALSLLSACPDIKLLLNAANFSPSGRRFGSYGYSGC